MNQQTPSSPQFSPDGQWWWNGSEWVPAASAAPQQPPAPPTPPGRRRRRWPWVVLGLVVLLGIGVCSAAVSNTNQSQTASTKATATPAVAPTRSAAAAQPTAAPKPAQTATPAPGPRTLVDLQGSGIKNTTEFNAPGHWKLHYSYDCSNFGSQGNFAVYVYQGSNPVDVAVNELAAKGDSTTDVYHAGSLHLEVNSECDWHLTATS